MFLPFHWDPTERQQKRGLFCTSNGSRMFKARLFGEKGETYNRISFFVHLFKKELSNSLGYKMYIHTNIYIGSIVFQTFVTWYNLGAYTQINNNSHEQHQTERRWDTSRFCGIRNEVITNCFLAKRIEIHITLFKMIVDNPWFIFTFTIYNFNVEFEQVDLSHFLMKYRSYRIIWKNMFWHICLIQQWGRQTGGG